MEASEQKLQVSWRWVSGVALLVLVALINVCANFVIQFVVDDGVSGFLYSLISSSLFSLYIPICELGYFLRGIFGSNNLESSSSTFAQLESARESLLDKRRSAETETEETATGSEALGTSHRVDIVVLPCADHQAEEVWSRRRTAFAALWIGPTWFLMQLSSSYSLKFTTVTSRAILGTTSCLFTLALSVSCLKEKFTWGKLAGVLLCMLGSVVVTLSDAHSKKTEVASNPIVGDFIAILFALLVPVYTAVTRVTIPEEDEKQGKCSVAHVYGYVGVINALLFGPIGLVLHLTGIEPFQGLTRAQLCLVVATGLIGTMLNGYLWARAMLLTSPTLGVTGMILEVPMSAAVDSIRGSVPSFVSVMGGIAVLIGFFGINQSTVREKDEANVGLNEDVSERSEARDEPHKPLKLQNPPRKCIMRQSFRDSSLAV